MGKRETTQKKRRCRSLQSIECYSPTEISRLTIPSGDRERCLLSSWKTPGLLSNIFGRSWSSIFSSSCLILLTWLWIGTQCRCSIPCCLPPPLLCFIFSISRPKSSFGVTFLICYVMVTSIYSERERERESMNIIFFWPNMCSIEHIIWSMVLMIQRQRLVLIICTIFEGFYFILLQVCGGDDL